MSPTLDPSGINEKHLLENRLGPKLLNLSSSLVVVDTWWIELNQGSLDAPVPMDSVAMTTRQKKVVISFGIATCLWWRKSGEIFEEKGLIGSNQLCLSRS